MANAVTWKNIGTVSGAGALAAAASGGQNISAGIANVGKAFSQYGDDKIQQETDLAVNALRAAAPKDRQALMQSFVDSNISMHSDQIGKAASDIDLEEMKREDVDLQKEKFGFEKTNYANERADSLAFSEQLKGALATGGGKKTNLANMLASATNSDQVRQIKGSMDAIEIANAEQLNNFRVGADNNEDITGYADKVKQFAKSSGKTASDVFAETPVLTQEYIYNRATTGEMLKKSQDLNTGLDRVGVLVQNGTSTDLAEARKILTTLDKDLNSTVADFNKDLVSRGINAEVISTWQQNASSPLGSLMAKKNSLTESLADIDSSKRIEASKQATEMEQALREKQVKHDPETIYTHLMKGRNDSYKDEAEGIERNFNKALHAAPRMLKSESTQWAFVEAFKEMSGVENRSSFLLKWAEDGYNADADRVYRLALSKLKMDPHAMRVAGLTKAMVVAEENAVRARKAPKKTNIIKTNTSGRS